MELWPLSRSSNKKSPGNAWQRGRHTRADHGQGVWHFLLVLATVFVVAALATACTPTRSLEGARPPAQRPVPPGEQPWPENHVLILAYHEVQDSDPDQTFMSVSTEHLIGHFSWLRENGYQPVSIEQILAARRGAATLPPKAVLLSFDDGYRSFETRVLPLLNAYEWPALLAPVGRWADTPPGQNVLFGDLPVPRERFLDWQALQRIAASGRVEIAAHTDNLHFGQIANPQGNRQPAAAIHAYNPETGQYETDAQYRQRIRTDGQRITEKIRKTTQQAPRVWVWPYGEGNGQAIDELSKQGYELFMSLDWGLADVHKPGHMPRLLISHDPDVTEFATLVLAMEENAPLRVAHVDLDYVYDPDAEQMERNLGQLVQRIADLQINTVFLQAFADPAGDGLARSLYFPNRHLPVRADLFNRTAWQLRSRAQVAVYAWMPVLAFDLPARINRVQAQAPDSPSGTDTLPRPDPAQYQRISPFDPEGRRMIGEIYEDLARHAIFAGLLFHDDALLSDHEDLSPPALQAYSRAGLNIGPKRLPQDDATRTLWTQFKDRALVDLTRELAAKVQAIRGPQVRTARNLYARPVLEPASQAWFAQSLDAFLEGYDWTALMAMPRMEQVAPDQEGAWLEHLVARVGEHPNGLQRTVFQVQARDWRRSQDSRNPTDPLIHSSVIAGWLTTLQRRGALNLGYYPDDFVRNHPDPALLRPVLSNGWFPFVP